VLRDDSEMVSKVLDVDPRERSIVEEYRSRRRFIETLKESSDRGFTRTGSTTREGE
jgi:hypothetical protein